MSEDEITVRFGANVSADLRVTLTDAEVRSTDVLEFSAAQQWAEVVSLLVGPGGAAYMLRPVLLALIEKWRDRSIRIKHDDVEIETRGCTSRDVDRLLDSLQKASEQRAAEWRKLRDRNE